MQSLRRTLAPSGDGLSFMRELVLTGMEETWPAEPENALFLGPWCFAFRKEASNLLHGFSLGESPWTGSEWVARLRVAGQYLEDLRERLMVPIGHALNVHYGVHKAPRFWSSILAYWFHAWLGIVYDRFLHLEAFASGSERFSVKTCRSFEFGQIAQNPEALFKHWYTHEFNWCLFSEILHRLDFAYFELVPVSTSLSCYPLPSRTAESHGARESNWSAVVLRTVKQTVRSMIRGRNTSARLIPPVHIQPYRMSKEDAKDIALQASQMVRQPAAEIRTAGLSDRKALENRLGQTFTPRGRFETLVTGLLCHHLPESFYHLPLRKSAVLPGIRITPGGFGVEEAETIEAGGSVYCQQHGGGYGNYAAFPLAAAEYQSPTGFITWGWTGHSPYKAKFYPLPDPELSMLPEHVMGAGTELVFLSTEHPAYNYRLHSALLAHTHAAHTAAKIAFINALDGGVKSQLVYRGYAHDYGHADRQIITDQTGIVRFWEWAAEDPRPRFSQSRLLVIDHLSTALIDTLVMNCPTVALWSENIFAICEEAEPYFKELKSVRILFQDPVEAAAHVNGVWDSVQEWWYSDEVQQARKGFCQQFGRTSLHWKEEWVRFIKERLDEIYSLRELTADLILSS
ncbi:MAG: hypothetical protein HS115_10295 [Spirochaetales bacterium]|nr:hypothetical protein [Spirochaetales bacterium]